MESNRNKNFTNSNFLTQVLENEFIYVINSGGKPAICRMRYSQLSCRSHLKSLEYIH